MHWADSVAQNLARRGDSHTIAAGITPSGVFHIGHIREVVTCDIIMRACNDAGMNARLLFIVDSIDPLRKVYPFLHSDYEKYIGHPLYKIPPPDSEGRPDLEAEHNYAAHFLNPFVEALRELGVHPELSWNHEAYESGKFEDASRIFLNRRNEVAKILTEISGRPIPENWYPYTPIGNDGSMDGLTVTGWDDPYVLWIDEEGNEGKSHIGTAEGKLPWRMDWPAKWAVHGVTCEPFGKDHAASGGSYSTGRQLVEFLGAAPPIPVPYEWIQLKGMGPMSSSTNVIVGPLEALDIVPPEILRFLISSNKPKRHIEFDTGTELIKKAELYDHFCRIYANENEKSNEDDSARKVKLKEEQRGSIRFAQVVPRDMPMIISHKASFSHLSMLAQIRSDDESVWESMRASGMLDGEPPESLVDRLRRMRNWISSKHFPDGNKLVIQTSVTDEAKEALLIRNDVSPDDSTRSYLAALVETYRACEWKDETIQNAICDYARDHDIGLREAFVILYNIHLGKDYGPKLASLIAEIPREDAIAPLVDALSILDGA
ncbi:MAG: lysine--tRNA ligase [Candidatus Poseidoniales archaeon]|nr:MAG: lysine--tRNA ligase [Candidatus Poseidoniales archaeon]|tara:strand:- start:3770 stop:5404 length:1635 start_codon:yes stop_codon:yes gene_type:complete